MLFINFVLKFSSATIQVQVVINYFLPAFSPISQFLSRVDRMFENISARIYFREALLLGGLCLTHRVNQLTAALSKQNRQLCIFVLCYCFVSLRLRLFDSVKDQKRRRFQCINYIRVHLLRHLGAHLPRDIPGAINSGRGALHRKEQRCSYARKEK